MEMATGFYPVKIGVRIPAGVPFVEIGVTAARKFVAL